MATNETDFYCEDTGKLKIEVFEREKEKVKLMEIDYIIESLMALIAICGCMMICSAVGWVIEELLPMIFPRFGKLLDKLMGLHDDDPS